MSVGGAVKTDEESKDLKPKKDSGSGRHRRTEVQLHDDPAVTVVVASAEGSGARPPQDERRDPPAASVVSSALPPANDRERDEAALVDAVRRLSLDDKDKDRERAAAPGLVPVPAAAAPSLLPVTGAAVSSPAAKKDKKDKKDKKEKLAGASSDTEDDAHGRHRRTEVELHDTETINHDELVRLYDETIARVKEKDAILIVESKQTVQIGRIEDNVEDTAGELHDAHQDVNATASCCDALMDKLAKLFCCCCISEPPAPHHAQELAEMFPPPIAFAPGNPKTDHELIAEIARANAHLKKIGEYEIRMTRRGNQELRVAVDLGHQADAEAKKTDGKVHKITGK